MRKLAVLLLIVLLAQGVSRANISAAVCGITPATAVQVAETAIMTIYNIFPIRVGGVTIMSWSGLEDLNEVSNIPICICMDGSPPIPRIGLKISLWEPIALAEVTRIPYCSPVLGMAMPFSIGPGSAGIDQHEGNTTAGGGAGVNAQQRAYSYQVHWWSYPVFELLNIFLDIACFQSSGIDLAYSTELDPLWQNDAWAAILGPEVFLVSNPIAQFACIADSMASTVGFPLDPLWWCFGEWGSAFPMSRSTTSSNPNSAAAASTAKVIMKLHREMLLWGSIGEAALCGTYPMPVMRKSQYGIYPIYPVPYPLRQPIGRPASLWGSYLNIPVLNRGVWVWSVYRKRDCCAF